MSNTAKPAVELKSPAGDFTHKEFSTLNGKSNSQVWVQLQHNIADGTFLRVGFRPQTTGKKGKPAQLYRFVADPAQRVLATDKAVPSIQRKIAAAEAAAAAIANGTAVPTVTPAVAPAAAPVIPTAPLIEAAGSASPAPAAPTIEATPAPAVEAPAPVAEATPATVIEAVAAPAVEDPAPTPEAVTEVAPVEPATAPVEPITVEVLRIEAAPEATPAPTTVLDEVTNTDTACPSCGKSLMSLVDATGVMVWCGQDKDTCPIPDISMHGKSEKEAIENLLAKWVPLIAGKSAMVAA